MRLTKNIPWGDADLTVKELTMEELAGVLDNHPDTADRLDLVFNGRLPSEAVVLSSGLSRGELHRVSPSRLDVLWKAVEEVNPFFLATVRLLIGADGNHPAPPKA